MLPSDKLFIDQLKTSDDVHIEQAPIDDDKKGEETWTAFRKFRRRRSFCYIAKLLLCTKTTTTFIIVRIAGQVLDLNALSTMAMVPLSIDLGAWMFTKEKNSINDDIDIETNRFSSTTLHLSKMTLFVYLLKDKLKHMN